MRPDSQAFHELLDLLREAEDNFLTKRNQTADVDIADNYKHLMDLISIGIDFYVHNDYERPHFVKIVSPHRKVGGDNAHALYDFTPVLGDRAYLIRGNRGKTPYMGFTLYGGENEADLRIIANLNSSDMVFDEGGDFSIVLSPLSSDDRAPNHIRLEPDANSLFVRQYFFDAKKEGEASFTIEALDKPGKPPLLSGEAMAQKLRSVANLVRGWVRVSPMPWPADPSAYNVLCPPYQVSAMSTGHWATPDNIHAFGFFRLAKDEALVLHGRSPECLYWSCHLWNSCMQTFDYTNYNCAICKSEVKLEVDGSWKLVIAQRDPEVPNWLDTTGYEKGFVYFRWLRAKEVPPAIESSVVKLSELRG